MLRPVPVSPLEFASAVIAVLFMVGAVLVKWLGGTRSGERVSSRSGLSLIGIFLQNIAFFVAGAGPVNLSAPIAGPFSLVSTGIVWITGFGAGLLFILSARALGSNWSLVARTRTDHRLVRDGPFRHVRHPIYVAMLLLLVSLGFGFGHFPGLGAGVITMMIGTAIRIREEERLLIQQFGDDYVRYAHDTPAFIPRRL